MDTEKQKLNLLCDAAQLLLENGSETYRVEETAQRMAKGLNIEYVNIAALPTTVFLEADGRACVRRISRRGTNSQRIAMVNEISRRIERGEMTPDMAKAKLERARRMPGLFAKNDSLCVCAGGGEFLPAFWRRRGNVCRHVCHRSFSTGGSAPLCADSDGRTVCQLCRRLMTAILAQGIHAFIPYESANAAIIGGIMPLLSGLAMTTAVRDTVYGDLISGMTRALEALLLAAAAAMGVYVGLKFAAMMGGIAL